MPHKRGSIEISSGLRGMRVERGEFELAGSHEDNGPDDGQAREAPRAALGGLKVSDQ